MINTGVALGYKTSILIMCLFMMTFLSACSGKKRSGDAALSTGTIGVGEDEGYGNVLMELDLDEFNSLGFNYGDSLDVIFSNGYTLNDVPYYTGYYTEAGEPLVVAFDGTVLVAAINYGSLWDDAGLSDGDTAVINLHEAGKYLDVENALNIAYTDDRADYESDEVFANFRPIHTGRLKENILYRSASPCDDTHNRAPYTDDLVDEAGIRVILDLADSDEEIRGYMAGEDFDSPYFASLYENGAVLPVNLQVDYTSDDFKAKLVNSLRFMATADGPYLVNCLEGKDRTGFVCALLESLTGADYEEMVEDYMTSYDNYYGITLRSDPDRYKTLVKNNIIPMFQCIAGVDENEDLETADLEAGAEAYLLSGGMTKEEVSALKDKLQN